MAERPFFVYPVFTNSPPTPAERRLHPFETIENNRVAFKNAPAGPNEPGKTTKLSEAPGGWKKQVCEKRYSCYCEYDIFEEYVMCKKEICGQLELLNVVKAHTNCVGGSGGEAPGPGGPGGAQ
jgi:hypothetical protein